MAFIPVKCIPRMVEYPLSTVAVTKGDIMSVTAGGYLSVTSLTSAAAGRPVAVAAETKNGVGTGRSALTSSTDDSLHLVAAWPATPEVVWEALTSSAAELAMKDIKWDIDKNSVQNETTTDGGMFVIEELVSKDGTASSSTNLKCLGRIITKTYSYGTT